MESKQHLPQVLFGMSHILFEAFLQKNQMKITNHLYFAVSYISAVANISEKTHYFLEAGGTLKCQPF
jgi:hypothetical protein